jgi:F-type H+-transporting ATPase subunit alpha
MIYPSTQWLTVKFLFFSADLQAVRHIRVMSFTCTLVYLNALVGGMKNTEVAPSLLSQLLKLKLETYLPTNVISITDGQIFLETDLFYKGIRPAVNVGSSVSRVGSSAQIKAMKKVAGTLKLDLAQYRELEAFAQFGSDLDESTKRQLERGKRSVEVLKQPQYSPIKMEHQVVVFYALTKGYMDDVPVEKIKAFEAGLIEYAERNAKVFFKDIATTKMWSDKGEEELKKVIADFKASFIK